MDNDTSSFIIFMTLIIGMLLIVGYVIYGSINKGFSEEALQQYLNTEAAVKFCKCKCHMPSEE